MIQEELPDKIDTGVMVNYTIKIPLATKQQIEFVTVYKDGLTDEIRRGIKETVSRRFEQVRRQQEAQSA